MFVVVQVRQTLQQAGTAGPYSAALLVIRAALTLSCRSIGTSVERPLARRLQRAEACAYPAEDVVSIHERRDQTPIARQPVAQAGRRRHGSSLPCRSPHP
jgi:hypothetical protein